MTYIDRTNCEHEWLDLHLGYISTLRSASIDNYSGISAYLFLCLLYMSLLYLLHCLWSMQWAGWRKYCGQVYDMVFSFFEYLYKEGEAQISTTIVHPFKLRSPSSASKSYKSLENLAKIIDKPPPEVSKLGSLGDLRIIIIILL